MKPIESNLMDTENPRVYRLVLTGGMTVSNITQRLFHSVGGKGKSRGFSLSHFIFRHHPVALFLSSSALSVAVFGCSIEHLAPCNSMCFSQHQNFHEGTMMCKFLIVAPSLQNLSRCGFDANFISDSD